MVLLIGVLGILAADAFLLLEASDHNDKQEGTHAQVRARLVDTRYGIKLQDFQFLLPSPEKYEAFAAAIAKTTSSQLAQIKENTHEMCLIGVIGFKNVDPVHSRYDDAQEGTVDSGRP